MTVHFPNVSPVGEDVGWCAAIRPDSQEKSVISTKSCGITVHLLSLAAGQDCGGGALPLEEAGTTMLDMARNKGANTTLL